MVGHRAHGLQTTAAIVRRTPCRRALWSVAMSTFALSVAGFVLSIVANVWSFGLTFVRWPRVSVETRAHIVLVPGGPNQDKIVLTVINRGSEAVTVSDIGLHAEEGGQWRGFEYDDLHQPRFVPSGDPLPVRLEGHGALRWIYKPEQLDGFRKGTDVRGYAKVYRTFRWRSEITERTINGPRTEKIQ